MGCKNENIQQTNLPNIKSTYPRLLEGLGRKYLSACESRSHWKRKNNQRVHVLILILRTKQNPWKEVGNYCNTHYSKIYDNVWNCKQWVLKGLQNSQNLRTRQKVGHDSSFQCLADHERKFCCTPANSPGITFCKNQLGLSALIVLLHELKTECDDARNSSSWEVGRNIGTLPMRKTFRNHNKGITLTIIWHQLLTNCYWWLELLWLDKLEKGQYSRAPYLSVLPRRLRSPVLKAAMLYSHRTYDDNEDNRTEECS